MVRHVQLVMETAKPGMELFVLIMLPIGACRIAKVDSASEGAAGMNAAQSIDLKGATRSIPGMIRRQDGQRPARYRRRRWRRRLNRWQFADESRQFHRGHVQPVPKLLESAAPPRRAAQRPPSVDGPAQRSVDIRHGQADLSPPSGFNNGIAQFVFHFAPSARANERVAAKLRSCEEAPANDTLSGREAFSVFLFLKSNS